MSQPRPKSKTAKQNNNNKKKGGQIGSDRLALVNQQKEVRIGRPQMTASTQNDGSIRVRHREYLGDIAGSIAFAATSYPINPGLAAVFPWLSSISTQFESYSFNSLRFEFETMKSTATDGSLMMVVDYDASDAAPVSKQAFMNTNHAVRSPVWSECTFDSDFKEMHKIGPSHYVRAGALAANLDIKTYDVGQFFLAVQGCADASTLGELYVSYDIVLQTPQVGGNAPGGADYYSKSVVSGGVVSRTAPFGTAPTILGGLPGSVSSNTIVFDIAGQYLMNMSVTGTGITAIPVLTLTNATSPNSGIVMPTIILASGTDMEVCYLITVGNGGSVLYNFTAVSATITNVRFFITAIQGSVFS